MNYKLSIITINYNNCVGLKRTIESVLSQTYNNIEYIVIDGNSSDGSGEVIKQNCDRIDYWVSEPDTGIYNAMNKGVRQATGDYCLFLNSGDFLDRDSVIEEFISQLSDEDIIMGREKMLPSERIAYVDVKVPLTMMDFFVSCPIPHQACLVRRTLFDNHLYDEKLRIVADWKFFLQIIVMEGCTYKIVDTVVSDFQEGGVSDDKQNCDEERSVVLREMLPQAVLLDYERFQHGEAYENCNYDKFFAALKRYSPKTAGLIYRVAVGLARLMSHRYSTLRFAKNYPSKI